MLNLIARRLMLLIAILVAVSMLTFAIVNVLPGDVAVAILGDTATPSQVAALRTRLGLDQPLVMRYFAWVAAFLRYRTPEPLITHRARASVDFLIQKLA